MLGRRDDTHLPMQASTSTVGLSFGKVYGDLNFVTDLAQQFPLSVVGPSHPVVVPLRVARAGRHEFFYPRSFLPYAFGFLTLIYRTKLRAAVVATGRLRLSPF